MATLLLDNTLYASLAFSFRKLRTAYSGNCVKIRRSSDSTEQDIGFSNDIVDTSAIASFIGGGQGFASKWYDQTSNSYDVAQTVSASQPEFIASGLGLSKPTGRYDGTDDFIYISDLNRRQSDFCRRNEMTLVAVVNQTAADDGTIFGCDYTELNTNNHVWYLQPNITTNGEMACMFGHQNQFAFLNGLGTKAALPGGWAGNPHVVLFYVEPGGNAGVEIDGVEIKTAAGWRAQMNSVATASQPTNYPPMIGKAFSYGVLFTGDIAELMVFRSGMTATRRAFITANVKAFYGIS